MIVTNTLQNFVCTMQPTSIVITHSSLRVSLSLLFHLYSYSHEFSQRSLLHTFSSISVAFTFLTIILDYFHFNKCCFRVIFTLEFVIFTLFSLWKCRFHVFLLSQVLPLNIFIIVCIAPSHITRGRSCARSYIIWSYIL